MPPPSDGRLQDGPTGKAIRSERRLRGTTIFEAPSGGRCSYPSSKSMYYCPDSLRGPCSAPTTACVRSANVSTKRQRSEFIASQCVIGSDPPLRGPSKPDKGPKGCAQTVLSTQVARADGEDKTYAPLLGPPVARQDPTPRLTPVQKSDRLSDFREIRKIYSLKDERFAGGGKENWAFHCAQFLVVCIDFEVPTRDMDNFIAVGLKEGALQFYLVVCPWASAREDSSRLLRAFNVRNTSIRSQEEASAMMPQFNIATFERKHSDSGSVLAALTALVELWAYLPLTVQRTRYRNLPFFQKTVAGNRWAIQASFRLPVSHSYNEVVDAMSYDMRTLAIHAATSGSKPHARTVNRT